MKFVKLFVSIVFVLCLFFSCSVMFSQKETDISLDVSNLIKSINETRALQEYGKNEEAVYSIFVTVTKDNIVVAEYSNDNLTLQNLENEKFIIPFEHPLNGFVSIQVRIMNYDRLWVIGELNNYLLGLTNGPIEIKMNKPLEEQQGGTQDSGDDTPLNPEPLVYYSLGDVVLSDGTKIELKNIGTLGFIIPEDVTPVAVIFRSGNTGHALGVGFHVGADLKWATPQTPGASVNFDNLKTTPQNSNQFDLSNNDGFAWDANLIWEGDLDGSDNWTEICNYFENPQYANSKGEGQNIENYPLFKYALDYGVNYGLTNSVFNANWYVPTISELAELYQYKEMFNNVVSILNIGNALTFNQYTSSSQGNSNTDMIQMSFGTTIIKSQQKIDGNYVRVIHKF